MMQVTQHEPNLGRNGEYLILLLTTFFKLSSDLLDSTQELHIGPTLSIHEEGKRPMGKIMISRSTQGNRK